MKLHGLIALLAGIAAVLAVPAAEAGVPESFAAHYSVNDITMREGLAHNFVEDIFRDSRGYVWIATTGSLARYDGYEFISFTQNSAERHIRSNFVSKVAEDRFGRLWVASDGGVDIISLDNLSPAYPGEGNAAFQKVSARPTYNVCSDTDGHIWLRNDTDVVCVSFGPGGEMASLATLPHKTRSTIPAGALKSLEGEGKGVWTGIAGNVCRLSLDKGRIEAVPVSQALSFGTGAYISDFTTLSGDIWVATERGLFRHDPASGKTDVYTGGDGRPGSLSQTFVTSLAVTGRGELVAGCLNGLNIYDPATDGFRKVSAEEIDGKHRGLNSNFINCLMAEGDNLWVGTEGGGISLFVPRRLYCTMVRHSASDPQSLSANPVNAIYEDSDGTLWVGAVESGLNRGTAGYGSGFEHFTREGGSLPHNSVSAISADNAGRLWVGTWGGGLSLLDRRNPGKMTLLLNSAPDGRPMQYVGTLAYDPVNNLMWIGVNSGIYVYDIAASRLRIPFRGADTIRGSVAAVISDEGKLWIGGLQGVVAVDLRKRRADGTFPFEHHATKLDDPRSGVFEKVNCLATGRDGSVWVGTNGNGIYRYQEKDHTFRNYNSVHGLPNDVVHGIAEDARGNLWIATYHGLACMNGDGQFINFGLNNGLQTEQFYWNAYLALSGGDILFGSVDGMIAVKGLAESKIEKPFSVRFTSLSVDGKETFGNPESAEIHEREKSFEVGFSAFDYAGEANGHFLYRMRGYEEEWHELPRRRHRAAYMNLSPGSYALEVKYVAEGQSAERAPSAQFRIEIIPYFYKSAWFMALMALLLLGGIWGIYRWRISDLTRQRNELKKAVDEGVKEISGQKSLIEEHVRELSEQNRELTLRNSQISEQKSQLAEMAGKVQQLTADRISFFTNITHEFRTPITLIIGPIERALRLSTNPKVIEQLNFVERNSRYLLSLINQLMDFRKIEAGKMEISTSRGNIRELIEEIVLPFRAYAEERGIELRTLCHLPHPVVSYNEDAVRKVLTNLLGNAIKFTPDKGTVTVYASLFGAGCLPDGEVFYLCVSDSGCGLGEGETEKVFEHFYQGKSQIRYPLIGSADSGIGLYLCRKLVEVFGGRITARNNRGKGCSFRVVMPVKGADPESASGAGDSSLLLPAAAPGESAETRRLRVLVVEDNADMRAFMRSVLSDRYDVEEACDGAEALGMLQTKDTDLIISDLMMPVMDGLELAGKVKENFAISHIPFIMLTAKTSQESRLEGYRRGVDAYILKPFDEDMLLARISNILANKRRYQQKFVADMQVESLGMNEESRDKKFVNKVMEVLKENYSNSYYDVGEFAEALGVSRSLLNKKLQSLLGQGANQLMRAYRLNTARELIMQNRSTRNMNVSEIAFRVGFNDSKYFTRCFTKQFGINPSVLLRGEDNN